MLAQQALEAIAGKLPRQQAFQKFLDALRNEQQDAMGEAPIIQAGNTMAEHNGHHPAEYCSVKPTA